MTERNGPTIGRRTILASAGMGIAGAALADASAGMAAPPPRPIDEGAATGGKITFPAITTASDRPSPPPPAPDAPGRRVGFAIMGLGRLSLEQLLPAFSECRHARPVALVSGEPNKLRTVAAQYGIAASSCYDYAGFDRIRADAGVEAVYVVTPNALHREHVIRAAAAGKHVLCEKPMATSPDEARAMIAACKSAGRLLMVAYRCQYETTNSELARRARTGALGTVQLIDAVNVQNQGDPEQWRQRIALAGGGSLPDIGLYCLNTARALLGEEPVEVSATIFSPSGDPRFREVEANVAFVLRFASGVTATCTTSYAAHERRDFAVYGSEAAARIDNAFAYRGQTLRIARREGDAESVAEIVLPARNQFALEIDHFAQCVRTGTRPRTPGEEGLQDQLIMAAIYESARTRRPVALAPHPGRDVFRGPLPAAS